MCFHCLWPPEDVYAQKRRCRCAPDLAWILYRRRCRHSNTDLMCTGCDYKWTAEGLLSGQCSKQQLSVPLMNGAFSEWSDQTHVWLVELTSAAMCSSINFKLGGIAYSICAWSASIHPMAARQFNRIWTAILLGAEPAVISFADDRGWSAWAISSTMTMSDGCSRLLRLGLDQAYHAAYLHPWVTWPASGLGQQNTL